LWCSCTGATAGRTSASPARSPTGKSMTPSTGNATPRQRALHRCTQDALQRATATACALSHMRWTRTMGAVRRSGGTRS
jgi:hypothetical protein